jgi:hypothetical protein
MDSVQAGGSVEGTHLDYVHGSMRVVPSATKGRTVVATAAIEADTLIMVSKAFGMQGKAAGDPTVLSLDSYETRANLQFATALGTKLQSMLPKDRRLFFSLSAGDNAALSVDLLNAEMQRLSQTRPSPNTAHASDAAATAAGHGSAAGEGTGAAGDGSTEGDHTGDRADGGAGDGCRLAVEGMQERLLNVIRSNAFRTYSKADSCLSELSSKIRKSAWERTLTAPPTSADMRRLAAMLKKDEDEEQSSAIFILPSLFNHSCCANVVYSAIGDLLFLRTLRRVEPGAELTVPYLDMKMDFHQRRKELRNWIAKGDGFACDCARCVPIGAIGETPAQREARADTELFLRDAYLKICAKVTKGMSKEGAIDSLIPSRKFAEIKREMGALPVQNQDALAVLLEFEIGKYAEAGDGRRALESTKRLLSILHVIGSPFKILKHQLIALGLEFLVSYGGPTAAAACRQALRAARALSYPEIPLSSAGNEDFEAICGNYCHVLTNHPRARALDELIQSCRM